MVIYSIIKADIDFDRQQIALKKTHNISCVCHYHKIWGWWYTDSRISQIPKLSINISDFDIGILLFYCLLFELWKTAKHMRRFDIFILLINFFTMTVYIYIW